MEDLTLLNPSQLQRMLDCADSGATVVVDWDNNCVKVLGTEEINAKVIMSDGKPMTFRRTLYVIKRAN